MDFKDLCKQLSERIAKLKEQIATEEATKNAFIMPFIQILGYDVFNPMEVVPELDCDLIKKKGDKIDYAIIKDNEAIMLIECKHWKQDLNLHDTQLQKYFVASKARFGVLTNGIIYRFYTDLVKPNIMDSTPFLEVDFENFKESHIEELKKFHKSYFDLENILSTANELKYMSELKQQIKLEFNNPSTDFVKMFTKRVYDGVMTQKIVDQFTDLIKRSLSSYVNEIMSDRLNVVMKTTEEVQDVQEENPIPTVETNVDNSPKIITTEEELEGFYLVKSILRDTIDPKRVTYRDAQSYFAIFVDDNNRKPICHLLFNNLDNLRIEIVDGNKKWTTHKLSSIDDIYNHKELLISAAKLYCTLLV